MRSGLSPIAFYLALVVYHGIVVALQSLVMTVMWFIMVKIKKIGDDRFTFLSKKIPLIILILILVGFSGTLCGLVVSAYCKSEVDAVTTVPYVVIPNMVYSGFGSKVYKDFKIHEKIVSSLLFTVRHGFEGITKLLTTEDDSGLFSEKAIEAMFGFDDFSVGISMGFIFLNMFVYTVLGIFFMNKKAPKQHEVGSSGGLETGPFSTGCDEVKECPCEGEKAKASDDADVSDEVEVKIDENKVEDEIPDELTVEEEGEEDSHDDTLEEPEG
jgi:hypothetical protein